MTRILVMFTGGTIGSKRNEQKIDVHSSSYFLIDQYVAQPDAEQVEFTTVQPLNQLSENLLPNDWITMYNSLKSYDFTKFDGVIITHGSDTLAYTSAAISYLFRDTSIPIILTASNHHLEHPNSNGLRNFSSAVRLIANDPIPGVFALYENDDRQPVVYLATRIRQSEPFTDAFPATYDLPYGILEGKRLRIIDHPTNPSRDEMKQQSFQRIASEPRFDSSIIYIKPYPGIRYDHFQFDEGNQPSAVLHDTYHSGTAGIIHTDGESLIEFIARCQSQNIDVYIGPIKDPNGELYATTHECLNAGAMPIGNISIEAALVKLMLLYGSFEKLSERSNWMNQDLYYERHEAVHE